MIEPVADDQAQTEPRQIRTPDGIVHRFPAEATDAQIQEALASYNQKTPPAGTSGTGATGHDPETWASRLEDIALSSAGPIGMLFTRAAKPIRDYITEHPAATAANVAGLAVDAMTGGATIPEHLALAAGVPTAVAAGTQLASNVAQGKPLDTGMNQAVAEGASQVLGPMASGALGATAKGVMKVAQSARATLMDEFPNLSQYAIDNAITISQGGIDKARQILRGAKAAASAVLGKAQAAGVTVPTSAATDGLLDTLQAAERGADVVGDTNALAKLESQIKAGRSANLDPQEADALLRDLQKNAQQVYKASKAPGAAPNLTIQAQGYADAARNLRQAMGDAFDKAGAPGYLDANAEAQQAIGTVRATRAANAKNTYAAIMTRAGLGGILGYEQGGAKGAAEGATAGMLMTPGMLSRLAIVVGNPTTKAMLSRLPPLAASNLLQSMIKSGGTQ